MRIGITTNEVIRNLNEKLFDTYEKYGLGTPTIDKHEEILDIGKLDDYFPMNLVNGEDSNVAKLINTEASFEINGSALETDPNFTEVFNDFAFDFYAYKNNSITFISKEFNRGINATYFFFSKIGLNVRELKMVETYENIWDLYDVIITTEPEILKQDIPNGKKLIKINASYNKEYDVKLNFDFVSEALNEKTLLSHV